MGCSHFVGCRQGTAELVIGECGFGLFGFNRRVLAGVWGNQRLRFALFGPFRRATKQTDSLGADFWGLEFFWGLQLYSLVLSISLFLL